MSGVVKALLILAAMVCFTAAQMHNSGQSCLCQSVYNSTSRLQIKDIQIYPRTVFCDKVEIVISTSGGLRLCLDPEAKSVKNLLVKIIRNNKTKRSASSVSSNPSS